jgi:Zn-dependent peptidase ImmA (M78 family)/transcriptional regulator with XRE-family HTH domain
MAKPNPEMITLAREFRGLTQEELAKGIGASQARIARIEGGLLEPSDAAMELLSEFLKFPEEFFRLEENRLGFGSSAYFYRKKSEISAVDRRRIHGIVNVLRIGIKKFSEFVELDAKLAFPVWDLNEFGRSTKKIAEALRSVWQLPDGPINDLTKLAESAGVIVVPCDFGTRSMDATSLRLTGMPPLVFINEALPGDRWRFTLAHEIAHLLFHQVPVEAMEDEADAFAGEFLLPETEMQSHFSRYPKLRLVDLANLKMYWKVSMGALLERAYHLGYVSSNQRRYLWMTMSSQGYRLHEPNPIPREQPRVLSRILQHFMSELNYSQSDLEKLLRLNRPELQSLFGVAASGVVSQSPSGRAIRAVR